MFYVVDCDVQCKHLKFYTLHFILYVLINVLATSKKQCRVEMQNSYFYLLLNVFSYYTVFHFFGVN